MLGRKTSLNSTASGDRCSRAQAASSDTIAFMRRNILICLLPLCLASIALAQRGPRPRRTPLPVFFGEEWKQGDGGEKTRVNPAEAVLSPTLELKLATDPAPKTSS